MKREDDFIAVISATRDTKLNGDEEIKLTAFSKELAMSAAQLLLDNGWTTITIMEIE